MKFKPENVDGIIFDLDGTLWDTTQRICEAWNILLKKHYEIKTDEITAEDLFDCMGLPMYEIAAKLFPNEDETVRNKLMDELCAFENQYLEEKGGSLYEGLEETLKYLSGKYSLYIVSNCQEGYIEAFLAAHKLTHYFKDTECWGHTRLSKGESNKILMKRNNLKYPVYVGDTAGDAKSAKDAGIPFIFAEYGFGCVLEYDFKIESIKELINIF